VIIAAVAAAVALAAGAGYFSLRPHATGNPEIVAADPAQTVSMLYLPYTANNAEPLPRLLWAAPWSIELREMLERMQARSEQSDEPILDFDPIIGAQDFSIASVQVELTSPPANGRATAIARFENIGHDTEIAYDLIEENGAWCVDNIRGDTWSLRAIAARPS
jgi:hypothetical protein